MAITKEKGDLGQSLIMADLLKKGHKVLIPLGEDWRFDLLVYREYKFERIQCKFDGGNKSGKNFVFVNTRSCNNWLSNKYTAKEIDWIAIYHKPTDLVYYVKSEYLGKFGRSAINLRLSPSINGQLKRILWAKDFLKF
jgi:hypothetical protein